jgi:hypothetical protein
MHWQPPENPLPPDADALSSSDKWMRPLYWLAGARWETLRHCPATERERVAVLGSTVLIPTVMSFLGMMFYAKSRFANPPWLAVVGIALAWSFVIMNTDRILLATYRPFQSWWRRFMQVCFRFTLAGVVSVAIAFPFCLDQYRSAITHRYQTEIQGKLNNLREEEADKRKELALALQKIRDDEAVARKQLIAEYNTKRDALTAQLPELQKAIINTETYADERMEEERKKAGEPEFVAPAGGTTRAVIAQIEAQKETLAKTGSALDEKQDLHRRLVEAIAREVAGQPNEFYPEAKKAGEGPRTKDMQARDRSVTAEIRQLEAVQRAQQSALIASDRELAAARLADRNAYLDALGGKRPAFVEEAKERERIRKERLDKVTAEILEAETEQPLRLTRLTEQTLALEAGNASAVKRTDERYVPHITRLERKMNGVLDPMEETIGLYRVIFLPAPDADETERGEQGKKWIAGMFQFLVIFGTLFVLDLVPIMAKIFSRPGPYDVLVEHPEFVSNANLRAFWANYGRHAHDWATIGMAGDATARRLIESHPRRTNGTSGGDSSAA